MTLATVRVLRATDPSSPDVHLPRRMALTDDVVRIKYLDAAPTRCIGATVETVAQGVAHQPDDLVARCLAAHEAADHG